MPATRRSLSSIGGYGMEARKMHDAAIVLAEELRTAEVPTPSSVHGNAAPGREPAVAPFPLPDVGGRELVVGVGLGGDIDDGERNHEIIDGERVGTCTALGEMDRRVDVRAGSAPAPSTPSG